MTMTEETRSKRIKFNRSHFNNQPTYSVHGSKFTKKKKKKWWQNCIFQWLVYILKWMSLKVCVEYDIKCSHMSKGTISQCNIKFCAVFSLLNKNNNSIYWQNVYAKCISLAYHLSVHFIKFSAQKRALNS